MTIDLSTFLTVMLFIFAVGFTILNWTWDRAYERGKKEGWQAGCEYERERDRRIGCVYYGEPASKCAFTGE